MVTLLSTFSIIKSVVKYSLNGGEEVDPSVFPSKSAGTEMSILLRYDDVLLNKRRSFSEKYRENNLRIVHLRYIYVSEM